jgi:hypothetical protein
MFPFAGFIFQAAMFWVITAVIARKVHINWLRILPWYILAIVAGVIVALILEWIMGSEMAIPIGLIRIAVICAILYFALRQLDIGGAKEKFTILGLFYTISFGLDMILETAW